MCVLTREWEDVDVVHRMDGALEFEVVEVEELGDEDVRVEPLEEPDAPQTQADAERTDPRRPWCKPGSSGSDDT